MSMVLPHAGQWVYADDFTVVEAAYLIVGYDPQESGCDDDHPAVRRLLRRIGDAYGKAIEDAELEAWGPPDDEDIDDYAPKYPACEPHEMLPSVQLEAVSRGGGGAMRKWLDSDERNLDVQRFSRRTLSKWLIANGLPSACPIIAGAEIVANGAVVEISVAGDSTAGLDFGGHRTEHLDILSAVSRKFWKNYDPSDPTTAPTNETVIAWLVERKVSRRIAQAMATILRPDGLPTIRR